MNASQHPTSHGRFFFSPDRPLIQCRRSFPSFLSSFLPFSSFFSLALAVILPTSPPSFLPLPPFLSSHSSPDHPQSQSSASFPHSLASSDLVVAAQSPKCRPCHPPPRIPLPQPALLPFHLPLAPSQLLPFPRLPSTLALALPLPLTLPLSQLLQRSQEKPPRLVFPIPRASLVPRRRQEVVVTTTTTTTTTTTAATTKSRSSPPSLVV